MPDSGKYDLDCEDLVRKHSAAAVALVILGGSRGSGFSLSTVAPDLVPMIARALREAADKIEDGQDFYPETKARN